VEEIVGDIQDEYAHEETLHEQKMIMSMFLMPRSASTIFNEIMDKHFDDRDYETLVVLSMLDWTRFPLRRYD